MTPARAAAERGVTRLCHFTPNVNLVDILSDGAIRPTADLARTPGVPYRPTDRQRIDGHPDKISCSVQYPNVHYMDQTANRPDLVHFPDRCVLLLDISLLDREGVLFAPTNAATGRGAGCRPGLDGFTALYAGTVHRAHGRRVSRGLYHREACPTDEQAEVLIPGDITISHLLGVVLPTESAERNLLAQLRAVEIAFAPVPVNVAPQMFDKALLSRVIRDGESFTEHDGTDF